MKKLSSDPEPDAPETNAPEESAETGKKSGDESTTEQEQQDSVSKLMEMETKSMRQFMPALRKAIDPNYLCIQEQMNTIQ